MSRFARIFILLKSVAIYSIRTYQIVLFVLFIALVSTCLFVVAGALTLGLYGLDALLDGNLTMLIKQFRDDPATQQNLNLADKLSVLADRRKSIRPTYLINQKS